MRIPVRLLIVCLLAAATSLQAATYIVPTDRDLVMRSDAIVIATAIASHSELTRDGRLVTIATLAVDEVLKGEPVQQTSIDLIEPGGVVGNRATFIAGSPRYAAGKRYLVFLRRTPDGWATYGFRLGQFEYTVDPSGHQVIARGIGEEISGWDELSNASHIEGVRDAIGFERFVKTEAASSASAFSPKPTVSAPGGLDGVSAIGAATGNWSGAGAGVNYGVGVSNPNATGGLSSVDHINAVLFNDPANLLPPGVAAAGGVSNVDASGFTTEVDVVVGKNFSVSQATFNALMTHEIGHTLGLRHSNESTSGGSCVTQCSSNAIMNSVVNVLSLQQWDLDAIRTVYAGQTGTGVPADYLSNSRWRSPSASFDYCFAPTISGQPASTSIASGGQASLTVTATGTSAIYQWYVGNPPSTTTTAPNGTSSTLTVSPSSTTTYWARVTACGGHQDSNAATVTVAACVAPSAPAPTPAPSTIASGQSSTLSVSPTGTGPFTYQWYVGSSGVTTTPINGATSSSTTVSPTTTTSYWVRVTGQCTPAADSPATTVTVAACVPPSAPAPLASPSTISSGQSSTLSVSPTGTSPFTYQWYVGNSGVTTTPIGGATSSSTTVSPTTTTSYWVRVTGQCAPAADSPATTVTVAACVPPSAPAPIASPQSIPQGQSSTLFVSPNGTAPFTYQWYVGASGDTSNQITGATSASTTVSPTVSTNYWVRVTGQCGSPSNSPATLVTVTCSPIAPGGASAQPSTINVGQSSVLSVTTSGSGPFSIQWYRGSLGDTSNPIATGTTTTVSPTTNTDYWVRVSAPCGSQDAAVTVSVIGPCTQVSITTHPTSVTISQGGSATLSVVVAGSAPISYQWYTGTSGDVSHPINGATGTSITVTPTATTTYWVHVSNNCNTIGVNSTTGVVTISTCPSPTITTQPAGVLAGIGTFAILKVVATASGTNLHYQWYKGAKGDLSKKVGIDSANFNTGAVAVTASYWVRVSAECGTPSFTDSNAAIVTAVAPPRGRAVKH